ncbi:hypothetical protein GCM10025734_72760 [Kitasatospora paranensis]|uniref:SpoIIE family protein phosphatase n=1 Tax=Kitasatospora paranensis TaxID=258053 RepID=UPI0031EA741C
MLLIRRGGHGLGALELAWPAGAADLPATAEVQLDALAEVCAVALAGRPATSTARTAPAGAADTAVESAAVLDAALGQVLLLDAVPGPGDAAADFRITAFSPAFTDPAGRLPHTLLGRTLADAYPLACADGLLARLLRVHATGEPIRDECLHLTFRGDPAPVTVVLRLGAARTGRGLLVCWQPEDTGSRRTALLRNAQRLARIGGFEEDLTTGDVHWTGRLFALYGTAPDSTPVPLAALAAHVHPDDRPAVRRLAHTVLQRHTEASAVFRLLRADGLTRYARLVAEPVTTAGGRTVGVRGAYQDVTAQHRTEIALSATRERLADSEQESAERGRLALRLQRALLPAEPPPLAAAGLAAAVRYRPAAEREKVGGDWYDALLLPDKSALLSLGDVAGHGVEAATGMVVLRNALRGLAMTGAAPGQLMEWLNLAAMQLPEPTTATAVCARYDPSTRELRWARAGHLPPVLLRDGEPTLLPLPRGVLLGAAGEQAYEERSTVLAAGDVLLLYTDGLIERREGDVGMLRELLAAAGPPGADLGEYLDRLLLHSRADTGDDTCLIAVRTEPV